MQTDLEPAKERSPILRKTAAGIVLVVVAALVIHFAIGVVMAVFWTIVAVAVVIAVLWALKTLLW